LLEELADMFDTLRRYLTRSPHRTARPSHRPRVLPSLECLEDRRVLSTIAGSVYHDLNANGVRDPNEPGLAGNTIELQDSGGAFIARTTTDGNGAYQFTRDPRIDTTPTTREVSAALAAADTDVERTLNLPQFDPALGRLDSVEILVKHNLLHQTKVESLDGAPRQFRRDLDATMELEAPGADPLMSTFSDLQTVNLQANDGEIDFAGPGGADMGQQVFEDTPGITLTADTADLSAYLGTGELTVSSLAHADVNLSGSGNLVAMVHTGNAVEVTLVYHYTPSDALRPGDYRIVQVSTPDGYTDGLETRGNLAPIPGTVGTDVIDVTVPQAGSTDNNFGELRQASVSGFAYIDRNDDGVRQPASREAGVGQVLIRLTGTDVAGGSINLVRRTAADGSYSFTGLLPGTYALTKESDPAGFLKGKDTAGSQGGVVAFNAIRQIVLRSGAGSVENNFGHVPPPPTRPVRSLPAVPATPQPVTPQPAPPPPQASLAPIGVPTKRSFIGNNWLSWTW
jgi:hypothetical protein